MLYPINNYNTLYVVEQLEYNIVLFIRLQKMADL